MYVINCKKYNKGTCIDLRVNRTLFGFGARLCVEEDSSVHCNYKETWPIPKAPPPPPKPPAKRFICEDVCAKKQHTAGTALDALDQANTALGIAANVYHIGEGNVLLSEREARKLIQDAGGYLQYILKTQAVVDRAYKHLKILT